MSAPTGKAAFNINGRTVHSAFFLPVSQGYKVYKPLDTEKLNTLRVKYRNLSVVFIDEVSMVGHDMLNFINLRLQQIMGTTKVFGGVSMILIGDLCQLQPVGDGWIFNDLTSAYGPLATNLWKHYFSMYELTEIMRQKDDQSFAMLLNRLREGKQTDADIDLLKERVCSKERAQELIELPHLFTTNKMVDDYNRSLYNKCQKEKLMIPAMDTVTGDLAQSVKDKLVLTISADPTRTAGLLNPLNVGIGLRYEVVANIAVEDGLTNGAGCVLKKIERKMDTTNRPSILWVQFDNENIGKDQRRSYRRFYTNNIDKQWTPLFDIKRNFSVRKNVNAMRIQFPLRPAGAKTVHKAQGETLKDVVIHLGATRREHIHYVALSRATNISNLHILELNENKIASSPSVAKEMARLRDDSSVKLCYTPVYNIEAGKLKVIFHNSRSLHCHFQDIAADKNFLCADIVSFAETRLTANDDDAHYILQGYSHSIRNDEQQDNVRTGRPYHGLLTLIKENQMVYNVIHFSSVSLEFSYINTGSISYPIQIVFLYRSSVLSLNAFKLLLKRELIPAIETTMPLIILGDFNIDISENEHLLVQQYMKNTFNCRNVSFGPTTDYGTTIDLVFSNIDTICTSTLECPWSDHKAIIVCTDKSEDL